MVSDTILQHDVLTKFAYPFLLIFFIVFAVLEKTKLLTDSNKQINALVSFVISLIFVSAVQPKIIAGNLILFLTVAIVVVFVVLLLWGFISSPGKDKFEMEKWMKYTLWAVAGVAVVVALFWATGISTDAFDFLFKQSWSDSFWTNFAFVAVVVAALAIILKNSK